MSNHVFYAYLLPLLTASLGCGFAAFLSKRGEVPESDKTGLALFANYSLANLYFVWCWDYVPLNQWRTGLQVFSTLLVAVLTLGQLVLVVRNWRRGERSWVNHFLMAALVSQNLPILFLTVTAKR